MCTHSEPPPRSKKAHLAKYGEIRDILEEKWLNAYRYTVTNDMRIVIRTLTKHIISHLTILGHRVLASYDGQPLTCFGCGDTGHLYQMCPRRRNTRGGVQNIKHQQHWPT